MANKQERGFAAMNPDKQRQIARKGGEAVARNRQHMADIGRKGGEAVSRNRDHMAQIGREGGRNSHTARATHGELNDVNEFHETQDR
jgi:general stress protein YciG